MVTPGDPALTVVPSGLVWVNRQDLLRQDQGTRSVEGESALAGVRHRLAANHTAATTVIELGSRRDWG